MGTTHQDNGFVAHCLELLGALGPLKAKRMFGGHGLYADGVFVAIISGDQLYLKTDAQTRPRFEAAGCEPFRYERRGPDGHKTTASVGYFQPPEEALEAPGLMTPWARLAMEAALRTANAKAQPKRRSAPKSKAAVRSKAVKPSSAAAAKPRGRKAG